MTRQEQLEAIWREFGRQPISFVPASEPMVNCRHKVMLTIGGRSEVAVDEPVIPRLINLDPGLRVGQCPACQIIYWFTGQEIESVVRVDKDKAPDAGGVEGVVPEGVQEREKLIARAESMLFSRQKSRRIDREK